MEEVKEPLARDVAVAIATQVVRQFESGFAQGVGKGDQFPGWDRTRRRDWPVYCQFPGRSLQGLEELLTGNTRMIRVEQVLLQQAENHLIQESLIAMPIAAARVRAARAAEADMRIRILLAMQGSSQRDQSP